MSTVAAWRWPATRSAPREARHAVTQVATAAGAPPTLVATIALALTEAVTNAVLHAYREQQARPEVAVEVLHEEQRLEVVVRDHGSGLAPRIDSPGLGLGLGMIAQLAHESDIRVPPDGGTEVSMCFRLDADAA